MPATEFCQLFASLFGHGDMSDDLCERIAGCPVAATMFGAAQSLAAQPAGAIDWPALVRLATEVVRAAQGPSSDRRRGGWASCEDEGAG